MECKGILVYIVDYSLQEPHLILWGISWSPLWSPSQKLLHRQLGPFVVEQRIEPMAYGLKLPHQMKQLYPVFNIVKLTPALDNPITGRKTEDHPLPIVIDKEAE